MAVGARDEGDDDSRTATINRVPDPASLELNACWDEQWQKHLFEAAITRVKARVSPRQFQMFELYTLREWPLRRVAKTLGVSAASVYLAKHRIAAALKREVERLEHEKQ
ncbi:MAG: sigma-70 family RNA polymerase sigma factor [Pedosphaera sp.]|nr:sigma-70 family RNA polymerase sigma factor [Pedosphaera sp.]